MRGPRLVACSLCDRHAFDGEPRCPHCGASLRSPTGRVTRTAAAITMSLGVTTFSGWACAAYGVAPTGSCNDDNRCNECLTCGRGDGGVTEDSGACLSPYERCVGESRTCDADGDDACCAFTACVDACGALDDAAGWQCLCGSSSRATCALGSAPPGTCVGDHPDGAALALGEDGWLTCALDLCVSSCVP